MSDTSIATIFERGLQEQKAGHAPAAESLYRQVLARQPDHPGALHMLAILICNEHGRAEEAVQLLRRAIAAGPAGAMAYCTLGQILAASGNASEAIAAFDKSLALGPEPGAAPAIQFDRAQCLHAVGRMGEAAAACRQVLAAQPENVEALNLLGVLLYSAGQAQRAIVLFRQAVALRPDFHFAHNNLGNALHDDWQLDAAEAALRQAIALRPEFDLAHGNLANVLRDLGRLDEAIAEMRASVALNPDNPISHSNLLYAMHLHPDIGPEQIFREHRIWNQRHARPLYAGIAAHSNDRSVGRQLRIGYVSADFREHPVGRCLLPIIAGHDRGGFEITCYSGTHRSDAMTEAFRSAADRWRDVGSWSDQQLAAQVREDRIDILIDLALHSEGGRPLLFARKPAPVQVTFAGYPSTTGLETMDYRISDDFMDPSSAASRDDFYTEKTIRLPHSCFGCFDPPDDPIPVNTPPVEKNGFVTFASLNNFAKVTAATIDLWVRAMGAVPSARLLVRAPRGSARARLLERFARAGIGPARIGFLERVPRSLYYSLYHQIDLCLDTFPYTGHTTTIDALWMGVPVVSLAGQTAVSRGGLSILSEVGLGDLVADSPDQYVRIARELAADLSRLRQIRSTLRDRLSRSAIVDKSRFVHSLETLFRQVWTDWSLRR